MMNMHLCCLLFSIPSKWAKALLAVGIGVERYQAHPSFQRLVALNAPDPGGDIDEQGLAQERERQLQSTIVNCFS